MRSFQLPSQIDFDEIFSLVGSDWEYFRGENIFITGATGIIGKWLLASLLYADDNLSLGIRIGCLSRDPEKFRKLAPVLGCDKRIQFYKGDIKDTSLIEDPGIFKYFIHAATDVVEQKGAVDVLDTCVSGTKHALELARIHGSQRFLLLSSGAVYGKTPLGHGPIKEDFVGPLDFLSSDAAYANGKRCSELLCAIEQELGFMEISIARCFAMVGPFLPLDKHFAIGNFILSVLSEQPIEIKGNGRPIRSYQYMSDVVVQLLKLLLKGGGCTPYNIGSDEPISIADLAHRVVSVLSSDTQIIIMNEKLHSAHSDEYVPDCSRIKEDLGVERNIKLDEAILRTANWVKRIEAVDYNEKK